MKKRWKEFLTEGNRGLTLVELVCAIAIFSLITAMVGSALVVSAKSYNRGATEVDLQQDAQITENILTNLVIDSDEVMEPTGAGVSNELRVKKDGVEYHVYPVLVPGPNPENLYNLMYSQTDESETSLLAENVKEFEVRRLSDTNVEVKISFEKGGRSFSSSYNITPRNTSVGGAPGGGLTAYIDIPDKVVLEPLEIYDFSGATVHGGSNNSLEWGTVNGNTDPNTHLIGGVLTIGRNEMASAITFTVNTAQRSDGGLPLASRTVTVYIRRVNNVYLTLTHVSGTEYRAGAIYKIEASVAGTNLRDINAEKGGYTYVRDNKCECVSFPQEFCDVHRDALTSYIYFPGTYDDGIFNNAKNEDIKGSYFWVVLAHDIPAGQRIVIGAQSRHAAGETNESGQRYGDVTASVIIENPDIPTPPPGDNESGIKRGTDTMFTTTLDVTQLRDTYGVTPSGKDWGAQHCWFYRIREKDGGAWSEYRVMAEGGSAKKLNAQESKRFLPDRDYELEVIMTIINKDSKTIYWPKDTSLFDAGTGFDGFNKGWSDSAVTPRSEYSSTYDVSRVQVAFRGNPYYGVADGAKSFGSPPDNWIELGGRGEEVIVEYDAFNSIEFGHYQNHFKVYVEKWIGSSSSWVPWESRDGWSLQTGASIRIKNDEGSDQMNWEGKGIYRLGIYIDKDAEFVDINSGEGVFGQGTHRIPVTNDYMLCDPVSKTGYIYVKFP